MFHNIPILFALFSCLEATDEIIIPEPFYANYNGFSQSGGLNIVPITATIDNGFALPPIEEFEARITDKTKAIMICNPYILTRFYLIWFKRSLSSVTLSSHCLYGNLTP